MQPILDLSNSKLKIRVRIDPEADGESPDIPVHIKSNIFETPFLRDGEAGGT
jgi:hypothetical protein